MFSSNVRKELRSETNKHQRKEVHWERFSNRSLIHENEDTNFRLDLAFEQQLQAVTLLVVWLRRSNQLTRAVFWSQPGGVRSAAPSRTDPWRYRRRPSAPRSQRSVVRQTAPGKKARLEKCWRGLYSNLGRVMLSLHKNYNSVKSVGTLKKNPIILSFSPISPPLPPPPFTVGLYAIFQHGPTTLIEEFWLTRPAKVDDKISGCPKDFWSWS